MVVRGYCETKKATVMQVFTYTHFEKGRGDGCRTVDNLM
uniref:Uncharacterized protein n=1 Tax=Anguilla anguilla TaxID=7936 RepID=A0A0E9Q3G6_ANGAN